MGVRATKAPIHPSIKKRLGYKPDASDSDVLKDWKERTRRVCKPCWELKYCPYGPLVEQSPLLPPERAGVVEHNDYFRQCLTDGMVGETDKLTDERRADLARWVKDERTLLNQAAFQYSQKKKVEAVSALATPEERIAAWLGNAELPPIHEYRVPFKASYDPPKEEDVGPEVWAELQELKEAIRKKHLLALKTGIDDNREPLDEGRRAWFQREVDNFDPEDYPENIPDVFSAASCNIFGHICPVFFAAESMTETEEERRIGRGRIPFGMMMRIVRRDDYRCQHCGEKLRDDEVEFDHIIPVAKGGSSEEHNLRLTCYDCNHDKSDKFEP